MDKLRGYLLSNFSQIYFSLFLPFFVIASVIMLVKIAAYTAFIKLTLIEMLKLYVFMLPELVFYILPITFFVSAVMTISKLSFDYEMLVIFSLGIKPSNIVLFFAKLAVFQSLLLFTLFFVVVPHTKNLYFNFMDKKKSEAKFNIEASEYGHKFGDWMIFVGEDKEEEGSYGNVILFNQKKDDETLLIAKTADVVSEANTLKLELKDGKGFTYSEDELSQMKFRTMNINDTSDSDAEEYKSTLIYWFGDATLRDAEVKYDYSWRIYERRFQKKMQKLASQVLISLFPILSVLLILSIGVINARHQKGYTYAYIFTAVIIFYAVTFMFSKPLGLYNILFLSGISIILTYIIYKKKVASRY